MREDLFDNVMLTQRDPSLGNHRNYACAKCGLINTVSEEAKPAPGPRKLRRGNYFSQFTKKFSLGNGPPEWVQEYLVTKESGKMLGTLCALSIARMPNLESFVWDMPTGILRDIWISLASLGDHQPSRLEKLWIRFHDNKTALQEAGLHYPEVVAPSTTNPPLLQNSKIPLSSFPSYEKLMWSNHPTERPNFSLLPALRSLTVLAIDEIAYLDELSILIGRSSEKLRELRIGLASKINTSGFAVEHPSVQCFCAGSEIGLIMNAIDDTYDPRSDHFCHNDPVCPNHSSPTAAHQTQALNLDHQQSHDDGAQPATSENANHSDLASHNIRSITDPLYAMALNPGGPDLIDPIIDPVLIRSHVKAISEADEKVDLPSITSRPLLEDKDSPNHTDEPPTSYPHRTEDPAADAVQFKSKPEKSLSVSSKPSPLNLEVLGLEKCWLSFSTLNKTIDFSGITSLTLLRCDNVDSLWSELRRLYGPLNPKKKSLIVSIPNRIQDQSSTQLRSRRVPSSDSLDKKAPEFRLRLKRIHTDSVSPNLITLLKDTLAPDSLEWLFLQDSADHPSPIAIEQIYKGPLRRHKSSLTKLMIDSAVGTAGSRTRAASALKWMMSRESLNFITSGKMSGLRELGMVLEYKDWHFFLQRLPSIPHVRSLHVPHVMNHVYASALNIRELAMGVVDVVTLRPEVELCYLGISTKCYEILEKRQKIKRKASPVNNSLTTTADDSDEDSEDDSSHDPHEDEHEGGEQGAGLTSPAVPNTTEAEATIADDDHDNATASEDDYDGVVAGKLRYKLREILFYDDKISILKARHGRL